MEKATKNPVRRIARAARAVLLPNVRNEPGGTRTRDPVIKSHMLCQLSYRLDEPTDRRAADLCVNDVAEELDQSPAHVNHLIDDGDLPAYDAARRGARHRAWRVRRADLDAFKSRRANTLAVSTKRARRLVATRRPSNTINRLGL